MKKPRMGATGADLARETRRRKLVWIVSLSTLFVVSATAYFAYQPWRLQKLHSESREAIARGDWSEASLKARRALQLDPTFVPACMTMAEIGEHDRLPDAVTWRERVLKISSENADTLLAYASTALSFGRNASAAAALGRVPENARGREDYLVIAGTLAMDAGRYGEAAAFYERALKANPTNAGYQLALGKAQTSSDDYLTRETGRKRLGDLASHAELAVPALRALITSLELHNEMHAALRFANQLATLPQHEFSDELLRLRLLRITEDPEFDAALAAAQEKAAGNPNQAGSLLLWMSRSDLAAEGLEWVQKRAPKLGQSPDLRPAIAGCYLTLQNWEALLALTQAGAWKPVEYVRHAYRARAFREKSEGAFARTEWNLANTAATRQADALQWLAKMAAEWDWDDEAEQSLWTLLEFQPGSRWAIDSLKEHYFGTNNTGGLRRVAIHLVKLDPENEDALNDLALSSLLLNVEVDRALKISQDLHEKRPENVIFASTYAFALHCASKTADGLKVLESLPANILEDPSVAAYYGILLAASNSPDLARHFLAIGRESRLLKEERELVAKAEAAVGPPAE